MSITVVIVTFNSAASIGACLGALRSFLPEARVVVVDNASTDATREVVRAAAPAAELVEQGTNTGFARACNAGAAHAETTHVLFLNPDVELTHVDAAALERLCAVRPFGIVAPADLVRAERPRIVDWAEVTLGMVRPREWGAWRTRPVTEPAWAAGAELLVDRREFLELGGFDERFFLYYEDRDLARRYRDRGLPVRATTALAATHAIGGSSAHDGLRIEPIAWAALGWVEYVAIHDGDRAARRAAAALVRTLRVLELALTPPALVSARVRRKRDQIAGVLRFVCARVGGRDDGFCPGARRALLEAA